MKKRKRVIGNRPGFSILRKQIRTAESDEEAVRLLHASPYLQAWEKEQIVKKTDAMVRKIAL